MSEAKVPCEECQGLASLYCEKCEFPYCESCANKIHSMKAFRSHQIVSLSKRPKVPTSCSQHKQPFLLFCATDLVPMCVDCRDNGDHQNHEIDSIVGGSKKVKTRLQSISDSATNLSVDVQKQVSRIASDLETLSKNATTIQHQIESKMSELINTIHERKKYLFSVLEKLASEKNNNLVKKQQKVQIYASQLASLLEKVGTDLAQSIDLEVLTHFKDIETQYTALTNVADELIRDTNTTNYSLSFFMSIDHAKKDINKMGIVGAPPPVEDLNVTHESIGSNSLLISWNAVEHDPSPDYVLEVATLDPKETKEVKAQNETNLDHNCDEHLHFHRIYCGPQTSFLREHVVLNTTYVFRVCSKNEIGCSRWTPILKYYYEKEEKKRPVVFTHGSGSGSIGPTAITEVHGGKTHGSLTVENGIQKWIVPQTATYRIRACGAEGGTPTDERSPSIAGKGAIMEGEFELTKGSVLKILVGQMGSVGKQLGSLVSGGGGGGTFVIKNDYVGDDSNILLVAGGGGGGSSCGSCCGSESLPGTDGNTEKDGKPGNRGASGGRDGKAGQGGTKGTEGGAGAGMKTSGEGDRGGRSFLEGGKGGKGRYESGFGGFGGGGGCGNFGGGGGGGYSGGGPGLNNGDGGGGGGSFNSGKNQKRSTGHSGNGLVEILLL